MDKITRGIDHIGITVPDLDAATEFLREAFGARLIYETHRRTDPPQTGREAEDMLGLTPGASVVAIRLLQLECGASIELFDVRKADARAPIDIGDLGLHHFALYCDDVDATLAKAKAAGATPLAGPNILHGPEAGEGNRMIYIRAPWGTLIELISYPSGVADTSAARRWTPVQ